MARPTQNRTITKRFRVNAEEEARLQADAAEVTKGDESVLIRHRVFNRQPLATGKGMTRPELLRCLELGTALQGKLKGLDADADGYMRELNDTLYKALRRDL